MSLSDEKQTKGVENKICYYYESAVKEFMERCELRYLKKFGINAGMVVIKIMKEEAGDRFK